MLETENVYQCNAGWETINHMHPGDQCTIDALFLTKHHCDISMFGEILANLGFPERATGKDGTVTNRPKTDAILFTKVVRGDTYYDVKMTEKGYQLKHVTQAVQVHTSDETGNILHQIAVFRANNPEPVYFETNEDGSPRVPAKTGTITGLSVTDLRAKAEATLADDLGITSQEVHSMIVKEAAVTISEEAVTPSKSLGGMNTQRTIAHVSVTFRGDCSGPLYVNIEADPAETGSAQTVARIFVWSFLPPDISEEQRAAFLEEHQAELSRLAQILRSTG